MGMAFVVHMKISQIYCLAKKAKIKAFLPREKKISDFCQQTYICLESDKHFHVDFNSTVNMDLEASVCSLGIFSVCSFFLFSFFFSLDYTMFQSGIIL